MEEIKRIYTLLSHSNGLKIKEIAKVLEIDRYHVADILFSTDNIPFWFQDSSSLWFAKEGAIEIEEPKVDKLGISDDNFGVKWFTYENRNMTVMKFHGCS